MWTSGRGGKGRSNPTQQIMNKEQREIRKRKIQQLITADENREERDSGETKEACKKLQREQGASNTITMY